LLLAAAATCGGASTDGPAGPSAISLSSDAAIVLVGQVVNISVTGGTTGLIWSVNGVVGGDTILGRIDQAGHYTAPLLVPSGNPVHISAARSGGTGNASVSVGVSPVPAQGMWSTSQPRVITPGTADPIVFVTSGPPGTTSVQLVPADGGAALAMVQLGGTLYQQTLPASRVLQRYAQGDLHAFVGFLDYYAGSTRTMRGNLFVNVRDAGVPSVTVIQRAGDAQRSDHVVNIRYDSLFLGGGIPSAIPRRFYQLFGDDYDFLGVVEQTDVYANRNYQGVKNTETGFGATAFDRTPDVGSAGRLLGMVDFPIANFFDLAQKAALHEIGHRWMVYLPPPFSLTGQSHWPVSDMAYGMMGFSLPGGEGGDFNFTMTPSGADFVLHAQPVATHYNDLELYLMGLAPASEVVPHVVLLNQNQPLVDGGVLHGPVTTFSIDNLVAALGPRTPACGQARTSFSFGTIVLSAGRLLSADEMAFFDFIAARGEATVPLHYTSGFSVGTTLPFVLATNGRGHLSTSIH
jgi:hypothetical protein